MSALLLWLSERVVALGPLTGRPPAEAGSFTEREWAPDFRALGEATRSPGLRVVK